MVWGYDCGFVPLGAVSSVHPHFQAELDSSICVEPPSPPGHGPPLPQPTMVPGSLTQTHCIISPASALVYPTCHVQCSTPGTMLLRHS